ncbi:MAG TPA: DUF3810 domain-containing protein [Chitinophagaceae bacterium]
MASKARQVKLKERLKWILPLVLAVLVTIATWFHLWIEQVYAAAIYPYLAVVQRTLTGWIPLSLGDFLYLFFGIWLLVTIIKTIAATVRRRITLRKTLSRLFLAIRTLLWIYIIFSLLWGWNYHRAGLQHQLQLPVGKYPASEVKSLIGEIIVRLNQNRAMISRDTITPERDFARMRADAVSAYLRAEDHYPFLAYRMPSVKKSIYTATAQYFGFTGYYNPFTGEAQLRNNIHPLMKPFVLCHEIGHQLGYAKEDEASFSGYLAGAVSVDPYLRYSVYLELYDFARARYLVLKRIESDTLELRSEMKAFNDQLDTMVRFDRRKVREYMLRFRTPFSDQMSSVVMSAYEQYLIANKQAKGLKSYDDVISLLIAYRRKYGYI